AAPKVAANTREGGAASALSWEALADRSTKDAQVVAAGDLARLLGAEAAAAHRRDELHRSRIILDATSRIELVGADADVIGSPHNSAGGGAWRDEYLRRAVQNCRRAILGKTPQNLIERDERML